MVFHNHKPIYITFNINWPPHSPDFTSIERVLCLSVTHMGELRRKLHEHQIHKYLLQAKQNHSWYATYGTVVRKFPICYKAMLTISRRISFWCIFWLRFLFSLQWKHITTETGQAECQFSGSIIQCINLQ